MLQLGTVLLAALDFTQFSLETLLITHSIYSIGFAYHIISLYMLCRCRQGHFSYATLSLHALQATISHCARFPMAIIEDHGSLCERHVSITFHYLCRSISKADAHCRVLSCHVCAKWGQTFQSECLDDLKCHYWKHDNKISLCLFLLYAPAYESPTISSRHTNLALIIVTAYVRLLCYAAQDVSNKFFETLDIAKCCAGILRRASQWRVYVHHMLA